MDILVNVANQKLKIATNLKSLVAGTQEFVRFTFNLTGDWDDLMTFAQFQQNGVAYNAYLDENNSAYLPSEIGVGTCTLMLYGSNDKTIATTNYLTLSIDENILVSDANSTEISESLYNQLVTKVNTFQRNLDLVKDEIRDAYVLTDTLKYTTLGDAIRGAVTLSGSYAQAFSIEIVDELPVAGDPMIFYLVPNDSNTGYDKYWWITDNDGNSKWDVFVSSSTMVVTELPETGDADVDYILKSDAGCLYYKWIDGYWEVVAGSVADIVSELPEVGNEFTDYYLLNEEGSYVHHRWINGKFHVIGGNSYTKDEVDTKLSGLSDKILELSDDIDAQNNNIDLIEAKVDALGNLVSDVTESDSGIKVYYQDGSSKTVDTKDTTVKVEDVNKSESGLSIVYTDGSTKEIEVSAGKDGYTPVKGTDYFTDEDIAGVVKQAEAVVLGKIYPVGSVYISVSETSPASFIGGTWERIEDTFLLAAGSKYEAGTTGGEDAHTLTKEELPNATLRLYCYSNQLMWTTMYADGSGRSGINWGSGSDTDSLRTEALGDGVAHNNMPPYLAVYVWQRVA